MIPAPLLSHTTPTLQGLGGLAILQAVPNPDSLTHWAQIIIILVTALLQVLHVFKKKKVRDESDD